MNQQVLILEGFICPICFQNLGSMLLLHDHFEFAHSEEDRALLNQLKGLFSKAKKKILNKDEFGELNGSNSASRSGRQPVLRDQTLFEPQEIGVTKNHTDCLKSSRGCRIDRFVIETNKILVRLDKLLNIDESLEPSKRKAQEKSIVAWAPDSDVHLCMTCGRSFTITRRRHHCRLCGRVICNRCSNFLPIDFARKLTNPSFMYEGERFRRSGSNSSLNSIMGSEGNFHMRTCKDCRFLLERREEQLSSQSYKPPIVQLYEKIREYMNEAEELLPEYLRMAESLSVGESSFDLQEAHSMRNKLMKMYECITAVIKRVAALDSRSSQKSLRLQQMVSAHASAFVQENLLGLQKLPTQEEFLVLREVRRTEAQKRIAEERKLEKERKKMEEEMLKRLQQQKPDLYESAQPTKWLGHRRVKSSEGTLLDNKLLRVSSAKTSSSSGWKPSEVQSNLDREKNPVLQQIEIIKGYIKQAQQDSRRDEVRMLKENLADLEKEYNKIINTNLVH